MKKLAVVLALAGLMLPGSSSAAFCTPFDCAPSQFVLAHGSVLAMRGNASQPLRVIDLSSGKTRFRLPAGVVSGRTLVAKTGSLLTWYDIPNGTRHGDASLQAHGTFSLVGASQDGKRAVLARTQRRSTTFAIVSPGAERVVKLGGSNWQFDALLGSHFVLVRQLRAGYEVRLYDFATNTLAPQPLKDPHESAIIDGFAFARMPSADGRYLFTLYMDGNGNAMVHELDVRNAKAHCIDLPGTGNAGASITYALSLSHDGKTLWAISTGYGRFVAVDVAAHRVRSVTTFPVGDARPNPGLAALAPDGRHLAVTDAQHVWLVDLAQRRVTQVATHVAIAVAFSRDGRRLIGVGERSKVFSLSVHR